MENVANKLEKIAKDVTQVIGSNSGKQPRKKIKENETRMTLFKHNNSSLQPHTPRSSQTPRTLDGSSRRDSAAFAVSLHIPTEYGEFRLLSEDGAYSLRTNPNTIVFTMGEQAEVIANHPRMHALRYCKNNKTPHVQVYKCYK